MKPKGLGSAINLHKGHNLSIRSLNHVMTTRSSQGKSSKKIEKANYGCGPVHAGWYTCRYKRKELNWRFTDRPHAAQGPRYGLPYGLELRHTSFWHISQLESPGILSFVRPRTTLPHMLSRPSSSPVRVQKSI